MSVTVDDLCSTSTMRPSPFMLDHRPSTPPQHPHQTPQESAAQYPEPANAPPPEPHPPPQSPHPPASPTPQPADQTKAACTRPGSTPHTDPAATTSTTDRPSPTTPSDAASHGHGNRTTK